MATWLVGLSMLVFPGVIAAAPTLVQSKYVASAGDVSSINVSFDSPPTAGNLLLAYLGNRTPAGAVTRPAGWSNVVQFPGATPGGSVAYKVADVGEPSNVSFSVSTAARLGLHIYEYSGIANPRHRGYGLNAGSGTSLTSGSVTTTVTDELVFTGFTTNVATSFGSWTNGFVERNDFQNTRSNQSTYAGADIVAATAGSYSTTATTTAAADWFSITVRFAASAVISGTVFEDVNYGGGVGRDRATAAADAPSFAVDRSGVTVELYDAAGSHVSSVSPQTTDGSGAYSFTGLAPANYTVRVVNGTVSSSRPGSTGSELAVQTYRIDGASEGAGTGANSVGGERPSNEDASANSGAQTLAALQGTDLDTDGITEWTQSIVTVDASGGDVNGVDFGFNFDTIVNANDKDQGSLRQFILNSNILGNANLDQEGLVAGKESSLFMLPPAADPFGRPVDPNYDAGTGVFIIGPTTDLPPVSAADTTIDGTIQTARVGDTNLALLGTGGTVGVDAVALGRVAGPEVAIRGGAGRTNGILIQGDGATVRGLAIYGFGSDNGDGGIRVEGGADGATIEGNVLGSTASTFGDPGAALRNYEGIDCDGATGGTVRDNLIAFSARRGMFLQNLSTGWIVENNEFRDNGLGDGDGDGISINQGAGSFTGNLVTGTSSQGFVVTNAAGNVFTNNTVTGNGVGISSGLQQSAGITMRSTASATVLDRNVIQANYGAGVQVNNGATGTRMTKNSFGDNGTIVARNGDPPTGQVGIDLNSASDDSNFGTAPFYTLNDSGDGDTGGNALFNFPVLDSATIVGSNLTLDGWARPGTVIELFVAAPDPSGFGEGLTWKITLTEGGTGAGGDDPYADADATTGSYGPGPVNGLAQGQDNTNRFRFVFPTPAGVSGGTELTATGRDGAGNTSEFSGSVSVVDATRSIVKRAFQSDGTPIASGSTLPSGMPVKFLLYIDNPGGAISDVSLGDTLDPLFSYQPGTMKMDNSLVSSVVCPGGTCDEATIFAQVNGAGTALGDGDLLTPPTDSDVASYNAGTRTIDLGDSNNSNNARLDLAANRVWALVFTIRMQ